MRQHLQRGNANSHNQSPELAATAQSTSQKLPKDNMHV